MNPLYLLQKGEAILGRDGLTLDLLATEFKKFFPQEDPRYIDDASKLAGLAASHAWEGAADVFGPETQKDFAVIVGTALGAIDSTIGFDAQALQSGPNAVNPMDFPNTVANAAGSRIGIWLQLRGPNVTLTNGGTSFLDSIGFGFQSVNNGIFQDCFVGAVDKVPAFLRPLATSDDTHFELREGSCFFLASDSAQQKYLVQIIDFLSLQLKTDFMVPKCFLPCFERLWEGIEWIGCPAGAPLESKFPRGLTRYSPPTSVFELGLGGLESLEAFLKAPASSGIIAAFSKPERKFSFIKVKK